MWLPWSRKSGQEGKSTDTIDTGTAALKDGRESWDGEKERGGGNAITSGNPRPAVLHAKHERLPEEKQPPTLEGTAGHSLIVNRK